MSMTSLEKFEELKKFYNDRLEELNKGAKEKEGYTSEKKYIAQVKTILDLAEQIVIESSYNVKFESIDNQKNKIDLDIKGHINGLYSLNNSYAILIDSDDSDEIDEIYNEIQHYWDKLRVNVNAIGVPKGYEVCKLSIDKNLFKKNN